MCLGQLADFTSVYNVPHSTCLCTATAATADAVIGVCNTTRVGVLGGVRELIPDAGAVHFLQELVISP